ncbi:substrate import-associated zinc metallohydrolase lipoprotein [Myroides fluvii]|uniref:substrate import-associated zinc metallohydrolase lipoprotein n=1 Tax=Myroides fluvii TaxID=2572594 RepID=UPI00131DE948|nr:substrate import-associated zinc metallohydrolase lipoprotein [Myroides fluvii]
MKNNFRNIVLGGILLGLTACSNDDKLSKDSVLIDKEVDESAEGVYLRETYGPYHINVMYKWDRNQFGESDDVLRSLYPAKRENVIPAMDLVDQVWLKSYEEAFKPEFLHKIRGPFEFIVAGGPALNDNGTRTLGIATAGKRITFFELNDVVRSKAAAQQFIHTIQHEYIHIINQDSPFDEREYGKETIGDYTTGWYNVRANEALELGFITPYACNNIFEDFAEMASYMLTNTPEQLNALLETLKVQNADGSFSYKPGRQKILNKIEFVRNYFKTEFDQDFDELCRVANANAAAASLLNGRGNGIVANGLETRSASPYGTVKNGGVHYCQHDLYWESESTTIRKNK